MTYVNLGKSGLKVSRIALGTMSFGSRKLREWALEEEESRPFIKLALELGINFFDTADVYSQGISEEILGRALKDFAKRDQVVIATKVFGKAGEGPNDRGLSRKHIFDGIDASLRRLQTDYVDLYQIHRWDYETPIEETLEALDDVVKSGKVRYLGISSVYAWQFAKALYTADIHGWTRFVSIQNHYNLIYREEEREIIPLSLDQGIGIIPWSPLARGFLAGNRTQEGGQTVRSKVEDSEGNRQYQESDFQIVARVAELAQKRGVKPAQIALAWLLHQPGLTAPIVGATKIEHFKEAVEAVDLKLSDEERKFLEELYQPHSIIGHQYPA
ncbi:MAG: aldo/keto reductase [Nostoc sp.]|uniref:aldo/keto reductase n=1 Tax=Nostoc sp. TaxID=1180 RepID=UPI002FF90BCA